ncbi:hypothetical protein [Tenacibaculum finnmarkense]|uniref:hypothetical protein n=1 Tax=Tenacibaculum finnmarkense TaxID=2781243 RepID=UPI00187B3039|nr:hypothetical protein [Tenacibaculum finnmarkense]MBE7649156.1 hypothetical protein [Tenacibaculum finnmarkense genomovar ulcerans]
MIKITCNNIELNIVKASLSIVLKNTAFSDNFSLEYSQYPFLILEDKSTEQALGTRHILSLKKQREYDVLVHRNNSVYFGKLKVRSYGVGVRKCDLVFGSELLKILDKPIADFMPNVSLIRGSSEYDPITNTTGRTRVGKNLLKLEKNQYPDAQFQFPEIYAPDFYDKESNEGEWEHYDSYLNKRNTLFNTRFRNNYLDTTDGKTNTINTNSFHPCPYLLAPLDNCLNNIDFKRKSISDDFLNNILLFSDVSSNSKYTHSQLKYNLYSSAKYKHFYEDGNHKLFIIVLPEWCNNYETSYTSTNPFRVEPDPSSKVTNLEIGIRYHFEGVTEATHKNSRAYGLDDLPTFKISTDIQELEKDVIIAKDWQDANSEGVISGEIVVPVEENNEEQFLFIRVRFPSVSPPPYFSVDLFSTNDKDLHVLSETVDLSRHVPKWTFGEYLNNIKKLLNLKIDVDDSLKTLSFEYIDNYLNNTEMVDLSGYNLEISNYENNQSNGFKIKYANDEFARIDENGVSDQDKLGDDLIEIENDFLTPEFNGSHHEITKENIDDGVILMLNKAGTPNTTDVIDHKTLNLAGDKGIGNVFWKDWVKFRQNASNITLTGRIEKKHRIEIQQKKKVYYNNIVFLVEKITIKKKLDFIETTLKLQSKVF